MMKNKSFKHLLKRLIIVSLIIYVSYIFINQQKTLNSYASSEQYYNEQIEQQNEYKENLTATKENLNSPEYIQEMAREKLDIYLTNERIYIDIDK